MGSERLAVMVEFPRKVDGRRVFSVAFKQETVARITSGDKTLAELSRELGKGLLTRRDPGHRLLLERHRKDPPTICLPRKLHHDSQPFCCLLYTSDAADEED